MSKISTIYDAMLTRLAAVLTSGAGWNRLPNPYQPEENPDIFLKQGYGLVMGPCRNKSSTLSLLISMERTATVVISRKVDATDLGVTDKDTAHKQLLEDVKTVYADFEKNINLGDDTANVIYNSDTGINFVNGEDGNYIFTQVQFNFDYFENIN